MVVIEIEHLTKDYGHNRGVFDVTFSVQKGEVYGFLGPNGAGNTSAIRHIMGFSKPHQGHTTVNGLDSWTHASDISFLFSCVFNLSKNSLAFGAGIPLAFEEISEAIQCIQEKSDEEVHIFKMVHQKSVEMNQSNNEIENIADMTKQGVEQIQHLIQNQKITNETFIATSEQLNDMATELKKGIVLFKV